MILKEDVMKKLLILMLVLGLTTVASATPTMSGDTVISTAGGTITITVAGTASEASEDFIGGGAGGYQGFINIDWATNTYYPDALGTVVTDNANVIVNGNMGGSGSAGLIVTVGTYNYLTFTALIAPGDWTEGTDVDSGDWFTFDVTIPSGVYSNGDTILVDLTDEQASVVATHSIIVPEPITIALLGLGGLFLRRRK